MVDEIYDRHYREAHNELTASLASGLSRLGHAIHDAFEVLVRIEYADPWNARSKKARCN